VNLLPKDDLFNFIARMAAIQIQGPKVHGLVDPKIKARDFIILVISVSS